LSNSILFTQIKRFFFQRNRLKNNQNFCNQEKRKKNRENNKFFLVK
jgi:hypothetical protein